jgi:hypothetical protein
MRPLMWFRTDLRASDNPALDAATRRADRGVVAVYTICPKQWQAHDMAPVKVDFILRNLKELSAALEKKNIALRIIETATFNGVTRALRGLARELGCDALYFNREYEVNECRRDVAVTERSRISASSSRGSCARAGDASIRSTHRSNGRGTGPWMKTAIAGSRWACPGNSRKWSAGRTRSRQASMASTSIRLDPTCGPRARGPRGASSPRSFGTGSIRTRTTAIFP